MCLTHRNLENSINELIKEEGEAGKNCKKNEFEAFSKVLENKVLAILNSEENKAKNYKLNIIWSKESKYNGNEKVDFEFKKPKMVLNCHLKDVKKVEGNIFEWLDESLFTVFRDVDDFKADFKLCVDTLRTELLAQNLTETKIEFINSHSYSWNGSGFLCKKIKSFRNENIVKASKYSLSSKFEKGIR